MGLISSVVGSVAGSLFGGSSQNKAAKRAIEFQRETRDLLLDLSKPQRDVGNAALQELAGLFGLDTGGQPQGTFAPNGQTINTPFGNIPGFTFQPQEPQQQPGAGVADLINNNPGVQFVRDQGEEALARRQAATGLSQSGAGLKDFAEFNQGLASTNFQNLVLNPLFQLAGFGPQANSQAAAGVQNTGANLSQLALGQGNARASTFQNIGNAVSDFGNARFLQDLFRGGGQPAPTINPTVTLR